jgi:hypothetical protein
MDKKNFKKFTQSLFSGESGEIFAAERLDFRLFAGVNKEDVNRFANECRLGTKDNRSRASIGMFAFSFEPRCRANGLESLFPGAVVAQLSDGFNGLWTRFGNEDNGATFIAEGGAHLISEVFFILLRKKFFAIDEKKKGGRRLFGLRGVKEFEAMAA